MSVYSIPPLISSLLFLALGYLCYKRENRLLYTTVFSYLCLVTFGWQFSWFLLFNVTNGNIATILIKIGYSAIIFIPVFYYHFVIAFLNIQKESKIDASFLFFSYLAALVFELFLWSSNLYIAGYYKYFWGFYPKANILHLLYLAILMAQAFRSMYLLWLSGHKKEITGHLKIQCRIMFFAFFIYFFAAIDFLINYGIEFYPPGVIFILIALSITTYTITRHHFLNLEIVIKKTAFYSILTALLTAIFVALIFVSQRLLSGLTGYTSFFAVLMGSFLIALVFQPLRDNIQELVDKLFFKSKYDYSQELSKISSQITSNLSFDNILHTLQRAFSDVMKVSFSQVYLPKDFELPEVKGFLSLKEATMKGENLILPCITEGRLVALVVLGKKLSEDPYREEDLRLLGNLADQTAVALDHSRIYEENLKAEKQLLLADKLSSLGRVAAGLAHEIKNPLTAIKGMTQALERNPGDQETIKDFNAIIPKEVDRLTRLVENLSNLGKTPKFQIAKTNINTLLENNLKLFESRCRKQGINIVKELRTIPEIETDGERLTQVFTNLILNAIQAMPDGGTLTIRTNQQTDITIEISDTGYGIPEDKIKDIFEPFFTTKEEGTGLGLAITHKIIKDLGGEIRVESKVGEGTRFRIKLPT